jgi:hypothetical protein
MFLINFFKLHQTFFIIWNSERNKFDAQIVID